MLNVVLLREEAKLPTVGHPGSDLGFDLYAAEDAVLEPHSVTKVDTGIAARFVVTEIDQFGNRYNVPVGLLIRDRSSMAVRGLTVLGGVVDAGYTGNIVVVLGNITGNTTHVKKGDKVAQMIPISVMTGEQVTKVETLEKTNRGEGGFGSTGK